MFELRAATAAEWVDVVMADFDAFLIDHAACERKASGMAISLVCHYPDRAELVSAMIDLSIEELAHFREVNKHINARGLQLTRDEKDPYVNALRTQMRNGKEEYFIDRLIVASIVEARGFERFGLIASALPEGQLKKFYAAITKSEEQHYLLFLELAERYFPKEMVHQRLDELLDVEAAIIQQLPHRAALH